MFYNFLNSGQTGNFRYWTGGTGGEFMGTITSNGAVAADYGTGTYDQGEKENFNIGGSFIGGINYNLTDKGENTVSVGYKLFGTSITWGGSKPVHGFIGLDTGVSVGVGFGGSINLKTGIKW